MIKEESTQVIMNLSNDEYHQGEKYRNYVSSTSLKNYKEGAINFAHQKSQPRVDKAHFDLGGLAHDIISAKHPEGLPYENIYYIWENAPKNPKTGEYYGMTSQTFMEAYASVKRETNKTPILPEQHDIAKKVSENLFNDKHHPSKKVFKHLFENGYPEVSYFTTNFLEGINIKTRKDLDGEKYIVDYKTIDGNISDFIRKITDYGYDMSAGMYCENKGAAILAHSDEMPTIKFYWLVIQVCEPFDWAIISAENYLESGKEKFYYYLNLHAKSMKEKTFGSIAELAPNKHGIFVPEPSLWQKKINPLF